MKWKAVCASAALLAFVGVALSESYSGVITEIKDGKVTFNTVKFNKEEKKLEKGDSMTLPVAADVKVSKGTFDKETKKLKAGEALEGGLKNAMFDKITEKGIFANITTDSDNKKITEIIVGAFGKKKKDTDK
jgi:hypothetical protein